MLPEANEFESPKANQRQLNGARASADKRRGKPKTTHPATAERDYRPEEMAFLNAIENFKVRTGRKFPTWTEALGVLKEMGYVRPS